MRFIVIESRKFIFYLLLFVMIFSIIGLGYKYESRIKYTGLVQKGLAPLKNYKAINNITYKLPDKWTTKEEDFQSNEIVYHNEFNSDELKLYGFVQVWNLNGELEDFIRKSKDISEEQNIIKSYNVKPIDIKDKEGFEVEYIMQMKTNTLYKAKEYFIKYDDRFVRVSFFIKKDDFDSSMSSVFDYIVNTIEFEKTNDNSFFFDLI